MMNARSLGFDDATKRAIFLLTLDSLNGLWVRPNSDGRHFVCFCAMDARAMSADELGEFCSRLLHLGCAYPCTWGPDCQRVHDIMDEEIVGDNPPDTDWGDVMTTWHSKDSLEDALQFFLTCTTPDEVFAPDACSSGLIITVGSTEWCTAIEHYVTARTLPAVD
jgi:hypothetical protein